MFDTIFIHAGLPKTGSTHIQDGMQFLSRSGFLKHVAYPIVSSEIGSGNGSRTADMLLNEDSHKVIHTRLDVLVGDLLKANDGTARNLLLSSEQFFFATAGGFACLKEVLLRYSRAVKLIVCVRPLREWSYSVYMQMVKAHGIFSDYDEKWLDEFGSLYLGVFRNFDKFEIDTITFRYQETGLFQLFLHLIGEDEGLVERFPEAKVNRSLTGTELDTIRKINSIFQDETLSRAISSRFIREWPELDSAIFPSDCEAQFQRFASRFARDLEPLRGRVMTGLKQILFADIHAPPGSSLDKCADDQRDLMDVALREIRQLQDRYMRDGQLYTWLKQYAAGMRPTNDSFDPIHYLLMYPDLSVPGVDPDVHYRNHGRTEGRASALAMRHVK